MRYFFQLLPFFVLLICLSSFKAQAQFEDNFNNSTLDSAWEGDRESFIINNGELQLNAEGSGIADLYRLINYPDSLLLEGYFFLDFPPSGSNKLDIFFMTDNINTEIASGYYMTVGEAGADDALEIYRLDNGNSTLLWRGEDGSMATDPMFTFSISRSSKGKWKVYVAQGKNVLTGYVGEFHDDTYAPTEELFYHIRCHYTASRSDAFYLDDLAVKLMLPDTIPPVLLSHKLDQGQFVSLQYNEIIAENSLLPENFIIENNTIDKVGYGRDSTEILVDFTSPLTVAEETNFSIKNIRDKTGNIALDTSISFTYYAERAPEKGELLITEILPDPKNNGFIPNIEFTEVYNSSDAYLDMSTVQYSDGSQIINLEEHILAPGAFLIICPTEGEEFFSQYGNVTALSRFPAQVNTGDDIYLLKDGEILDELHYDDALFGGSALRQNGYSLELQNLYDPCADASSRWAPSRAEMKATPGSINSVWEIVGEIAEIEYQYYRMPVDQLIELVFNKTLFPDASFLTASIEPSVTIQEIYIEKNILKLALGEPLEKELSYTLRLKSLKDCADNISGDFEIELVGLNDELEAGDLIFNEFLYDSPTRTEQYIEIKNCSEYAVNVADLIFVLTKNKVLETYTIEENRVLLPQDLLVLSKVPADISDQYEIRYPEKLIKVDGFVSLDRSAGVIHLRQNLPPENPVIDSAKYDKSLHVAFLKNTKGVALERLGCRTDGFNPDVWTSAAQTENYGTPTYENSQVRVLTEHEDNGLFSLLSPTLSPDGDGFEDVLIIQYSGEKPAQRVRIEIYDLHGRLVKTIANNMSVAIEDIITWDGSTEEAHVATPGIYLLYAIAYDESGTKKVWKSSCVVAH